MYRNILIILIIIGILFIISDLVITEKVCPQNKIIYKDKPKTPHQELESSVYPSDIFKTMFSTSTPWIYNTDNMSLRNRENINQYFISQF